MMGGGSIDQKGAAGGANSEEPPSEPEESSSDNEATNGDGTSDERINELPPSTEGQRPPAAIFINLTDDGTNPGWGRVCTPPAPNTDVPDGQPGQILLVTEENWEDDIPVADVAHLLGPETGDRFAELCGLAAEARLRDWEAWKSVMDERDSIVVIYKTEKF
jgi:hypothetical protein